MSDEEPRAPKAKVDSIGEDMEPRVEQERHDEQNARVDGAAEDGRDSIKEGAGKVSAWVRRTFPGHENAFVGGVLGLLVAIFIFCVGIGRTLLIVLLVVVGVALGQCVDGDPKIINAVKKYFSDKRE